MKSGVTAFLRWKVFEHLSAERLPGQRPDRRVVESGDPLQEPARRQLEPWIELSSPVSPRFQWGQRATTLARPSRSNRLVVRRPSHRRATPAPTRERQRRERRMSDGNRSPLHRASRRRHRLRIRRSRNAERRPIRRVSTPSTAHRSRDARIGRVVHGERVLPRDGTPCRAGDDSRAGIHLRADGIGRGAPRFGSSHLSGGNTGHGPGRAFQLQSIDQTTIAGPLVKGCFELNASGDAARSSATRMRSR